MHMEDIKYQVLTLEEQHDMIVGTLLSQEKDYYIHSINQERYEFILYDESLDRTSEFAKRISNLLYETIQRKEEVLLILHAVQRQLPGQVDMDLAIKRLQENK